MTEKETVTVAGVPVAVTIEDGGLAVTVGRFDPSAAGPLLATHPRFGTATLRVYIADDNGDTAKLPDQPLFFDLFPAPPANAPASAAI